MLSLRNLRIGTKLAAIQVAAILLVGAIVGTGVWNGIGVKEAQDSVVRRAMLVQSALQVKAAVQGMQVGTARIRLSRDHEELKKSMPILSDSEDLARRNIDDILKVSTAATTIKLFKEMRDLIDAYDAEAQKIVEIEKQIYALEAKKMLPGVDEGGISIEAASADQRELEIMTSQLNPMAEKIQAAVTKLADGLIERMNESAVDAGNALAASERIALGVGLAVVLLLAGAAVFGRMAIARPLGKIASVLNELVEDRIVDVPYTHRGDEIGDIAKATEVFKQSVAEKVINLRVRSGLDVVGANVMITDDSYNIIYVNQALRQTLQSHGEDFRRAMPGFDPESVIGTSFESMLDNLTATRDLLNGLTATHVSQIAVGSQRFVLTVTPVYDNQQHRVGIFVEWRNVTVEEAIEAEVDEVVSAAVAGDFSRRVPLDGKRGFMLKLAQAINGMCENTGSVLADMARMFSSLTNGDLTQRINADYQGMFGQLKSDANAMADRMQETIAEIKASAREVTNASLEISTSTTDLSHRTEEQAASLEETSASMEEIASTVKKNAENAQAANQSAIVTREVAGRGGEVVAQAVEAMSRIEESSRNIADIIGVIDEIARQTNLLALNAAVEAARAGDAGRGFAVVASEVRSLAQRSSQAAKDIKDLIVNSNGQVQEGVELVNRAGNALTEITQSIKQVADLVSDIASASLEQSSGIEQVNKALLQMDEVTQQNSALVEENAATAKTLEHQAKAMDERIAFFRLGEQAQQYRMAAGADFVPAAPAAAASRITPVRPAVKPKRNPVARMQNAISDGWQDF